MKWGRGGPPLISFVLLESLQAPHIPISGDTGLERPCALPTLSDTAGIRA